MNMIAPPDPELRAFLSVDLKQIIGIAQELGPCPNGAILLRLVEDVMHLIRNRLQYDASSLVLIDRIARCRCVLPQGEAIEWR